MPMVDGLTIVSPQEKGEMKGLDVAIHEPTPNMTKVHVEQV